jgi:ATP-dependent Clp protease ATP-binding subunit ClpC
LFERMTKNARRMIFWARKEAHEQRKPAIGTEHLLYGVVQEDDPALRDMVGLKLVQIHQHLKFSGERQPDLHQDLPLSEEARQVLKYAMQEADFVGDWLIGTQHVFAGFFLVPDSEAAKILLESELTLEKVREYIQRQPRQ